MINKLLFTIFSLDFIIISVTLSGFIYTIYNIRKKKFKLIHRDYWLLAMYYSYVATTLLSFVVEYALFIKFHNDMPTSILFWLLAWRISNMIFTGIAITWSSGYKFGGTQPSGI